MVDTCQAKAYINGLEPTGEQTIYHYRY